MLTLPPNELRLNLAALLLLGVADLHAAAFKNPRVLTHVQIKPNDLVDLLALRCMPSTLSDA